ncbi:hypothetical protein JCGZ_00198 [Jatropha curcas]|uniref:Uncharacterized protein n=1 Tax=Jatropha curcas TaxID=180498 RepID=A0A067L1Q7_JATCU|nr:hypothetical protein JCGZ_00198 [Jatropha curcas]
MLNLLRVLSVDHEVLEREMGRLRSLYQQQQQQRQPQQQQQQPSSSHRRTNSRDLESQFANLSLKQKDAIPCRDPVTGPLRT